MHKQRDSGTETAFVSIFSMGQHNNEQSYGSFDVSHEQITGRINELKQIVINDGLGLHLLQSQILLMMASFCTDGWRPQ